MRLAAFGRHWATSPPRSRAESGARVNPVWGASGLLRERLAEGEPGAVFASANMEHRQALARAGKAGPAGPRGEKITTRNDGSRNPQE